MKRFLAVAVGLSACTSASSQPSITSARPSPAASSADAPDMARSAARSAVSPGMADVRAYGAVDDGATDDGPAIERAISAAGTGGITFFPFRAFGYRVDRGRFAIGGQVGLQMFNENRFSGVGAGSPQTGAGTLQAPITQPWLTTTDYMLTMDPASVWQAPGVSNVGLSENCLGNRQNPNPGVASTWAFADYSTGAAVNQSGKGPANGSFCVYRGMDSGKGGASTVYTDRQGNPRIQPQSRLWVEVDNDVLNVNTNAGNGYELDVNLNGPLKTFVNPATHQTWECDKNGAVSGRAMARGCLGYPQDGNEVRALYITGGGATPDQWVDRFNGTAILIEHGAYDFDKQLDWNNGLSIRDAHNQIVLQRRSAADTGYYFIAKDENGAEATSISKTGTFATLLEPGVLHGVVVTGSFTANVDEIVVAQLGHQAAYSAAVAGTKRLTLSTDAAQPVSLHDDANDLNVISDDNQGTVTIGTSGHSLSLAALPILPGFVVAALPACGTDTKGAMAMATDLTVIGYNSAPTGGGVIAAPVFCDGNSWTIH